MVYASRFLEQIETDANLKHQVESVNWNVAETTRIARNAGFDITEADLQSAMDHKWGDELSEQQLGAVVGGGGNGRQGTGPVQPDTSKAGNARDSESWSPPPGDVSGNSCFFSGH